MNYFVGCCCLCNRRDILYFLLSSASGLLVVDGLKGKDGDLLEERLLNFGSDSVILFSHLMLTCPLISNPDLLPLKESNFVGNLAVFHMVLLCLRMSFQWKAA